MKRDKVKLTFLMDSDLVDKAKRVAASKRVTVTHLIREFLLGLEDTDGKQIRGREGLPNKG